LQPSNTAPFKETTQFIAVSLFQQTAVVVNRFSDTQKA
jgi:hypothetical protein